jgi:hypothetical protein
MKPECKVPTDELLVGKTAHAKSLGLTIADDFFWSSHIPSFMSKPVQNLGCHRDKMLSELNIIFQLFIDAFSG